MRLESSFLKDKMEAEPHVDVNIRVVQWNQPRLYSVRVDVSQMFIEFSSFYIFNFTFLKCTTIVFIHQ